MSMHLRFTKEVSFFSFVGVFLPSNPLFNRSFREFRKMFTDLSSAKLNLRNMSKILRVESTAKFNTREVLSHKSSIQEEPIPEG